MILIPGPRMTPGDGPTCGACWKSPEGKGTSIKHRMDHAVVCLNADDAQTYAKW